MNWKEKRRNKKNNKKNNQKNNQKKFPPYNWTPTEMDAIRELSKWYTHFQLTHNRLPTQEEINEFGKTQVVN